MAICGSRSESIASPVMLNNWGTKTGLIVWMDAGVGGQESDAQVPLGNAGTALIGRALNAAGARNAARAVPLAVNSKQDVSPT